MKKLFTTLIMLVLTASTFAYDFSAVCPSGQTLYYNVLSLSEKTVALTYYEYHWNGNQQWETYYYGGVAPSGDLIIPETVEHNNIQFTVTTIGANALRYCNLSSVVIPNSITKIGNGAFFADPDLLDPGLIGELILPDNLQEIGNEAFCWNTRLTIVSIPNSVKIIGGSCFKLCTSLTHLTIGSGVEEIGYMAFYHCNSLTTIIVDRITPPICLWYPFDDVPKDIPVYIPIGSKSLYEQAECWNEFTNFIEEETLAINENETNDFAVYPNPTNNVLFVETRFIASQPITYRITNLIDQTLLHGHLTTENQPIDVANLPKGLYFISVGEQTRKFIVR